MGTAGVKKINMIGTSLPEYVFIRVCIFALRYTTPIFLACLAVQVALHGGGFTATLRENIVAKLLLGYAVADLLYAVLVWRPYARQRLADKAEHPEPPSRAERRAFLERCLAHVPDVERYLRLWFLGADPEEIRRDNLREFLLWAFFDRAPRPHPDGEGWGESPEVEQELDEYVDMVESYLGRKIEPGRGRAVGLLLTLDDVETRYRSVIWYALIAIVDFVTHLRLARRGFHYHAQPREAFLSVIPHRLQNLFADRRSAAPDLGYWYRPHTAKNKRPVVFLHGIGVGLWVYVSFLASLNEEAQGDGEGQIGIIAIEYLPVSSRLTGAPLSRAEFLRQMTAILASHGSDEDGWDRFVLTTHSYGSVLATHMLRSEVLSPRIEAIVLIDPVSILLHLPDVAFNFTRRQPRRANEWLLWYFASMDPGVAHCLGRHFFWKDNIAWKEDLLSVVGAPKAIPAGDTKAEGGNRVGELGGRDGERRRHVAVSLAEHDLIVDTLAVANYLAGDEEWYLASTAGQERSGPGKAASSNRATGEGHIGHMTKDGIELLWFAGLDHAQVFDTRESQQRLCRLVQRYCAK